MNSKTYSPEDLLKTLICIENTIKQLMEEVSIAKYQAKGVKALAQEMSNTEGVDFGQIDFSRLDE